jgi:class 3 adenylate cyclase
MRIHPMGDRLFLDTGGIRAPAALRASVRPRLFVEIDLVVRYPSSKKLWLGMERHLAAIIAGDIVGYSALMERDESDTFERLKAVRKELIEPEIERHHGRIFKHLGDGFLAEFSSVVEAVECAVALQDGLSERAVSAPSCLPRTPSPIREFRTSCRGCRLSSRVGRHK